MVVVHEAYVIENMKALTFSDHKQKATFPYRKIILLRTVDVTID
ncbi:unnamed protein product [Brugia timori]|uniref:Transposase n=1 Tax=Brugia timori TaxID=42155 RepID=A0A0R3QNF1_9BILA|nr:unnamed protein product [Brugia timori]